MNINNEKVLLLNSKIKFGEGQPAPVSAPATSVVPTPETDKPQAGLNALTFQAMNNLTSNPKLAATVVLNNQTTNISNEENNTENVAPFKSNIAFQGGNFNNITKKLKNMGLASIMALSLLTAATTMTSCEDKMAWSQSQTVVIDAEGLISYLMKIVENQEKHNQIEEEQSKEMLQWLQNIFEEIKNGNMTEQQFYEAMLDYMETSETYMQVIINQLVQNGHTQEEANELLQEILDQYKEGLISAQDAWNKIQDMLEQVVGLLDQMLVQFTSYFEQMINKQDELNQTVSAGFEQLIEQGNISNDILNQIKEQGDSLIILSNQQNKNLLNIQYAIEQNNIDNNANFDKIVEILEINKDELIKAMMKLGYTQAQIEKMTAAQIIAAIEKNTQATQQGNEMLVKIANSLEILPELLEQGKITNQQIQEIYDLFLEAINSNGEYSEEMLAKLEEIVGQLDEIQGTLNDILDTLKTMLQEFQEFRTQYTNDKQTEFLLLNKLIVDNRMQNDILLAMKDTQNSMAENLDGLKANSDTLLAIAKDDTRHKELIEAIKSIQAGGAGNIDYDRLEEMFKSLGITIEQAINMSSDELRAKIEEFEKTYLSVEIEQTEQLASINEKLDDIKNYNGMDKTEIINAINNVTNAINNGNENVINELEDLEAAIDKLQTTIDMLYDLMAEYTKKADSYLSQFNAKFDAALGLLTGIDKNISTIISNQAVAQMYLEQMIGVVNDLKIAIEELSQSINEGGGSSITLDQLEELWKQHDEANYNRFKELLENLEINVDVNTTNLEELLQAIDNKLNYLQDNNDILKQILNKLEGIDWTDPDYSAKLDRIIEILENFKCNCDCGNSNEGILGDLDEALG